MSMVMRQLINTLPDSENSTQQQQATAKYEHMKNTLEESIKYAKESLQLDVKDGMSWYILANCYVAKFFSPFGQHNSALLKQAISAYNLALKDKSIASLQSDLYFNKSMISMYEENWTDVLASLSKALQLDPHWTEARENLKGTLDYLKQINEMIETKGKLKAKKFQTLIDSIKKSDLGPYSDGFALTPKNSIENDEENKTEKIDLIETTIANLEKGLNKNKVLIGKVICGLPTKNADNFNIVCFSCCVADSDGNCFALTIYNLG